MCKTGKCPFETPEDRCELGDKGRIAIWNSFDFLPCNPDIISKEKYKEMIDFWTENKERIL